MLFNAIDASSGAIVQTVSIFSVYVV